MIIIIANQKGGPGKSTIALLLANFLTQIKKQVVIIIDMDYQQSIAHMFERASMLSNAAPYEVIAAGLDQFPLLRPVLEANPEKIVIIDLPGKLDDDGLIEVFQSANLVICPFTYSQLSFDSTILFSVVFKKLNKKSPIAYIPNRIKANVIYQLKTDVDFQLSKFGKITSIIPDRVNFERVTTFSTPAAVLPIISPVFEQIYLDHIANPTQDQLIK